MDEYWRALPLDGYALAIVLDQVTRYITRERIGVGGMAEIFAGELVGASGFARDVAIKKIRPELSTDPTFVRLFTREARLASRLSHPNIAAVIDFDRDTEGCLFLVMERVHGITLHDLIQTGPVPRDITLFIVADVLRALKYAHELTYNDRPLSIVHRDLSPDNVMISWNGAVKIVDFGVSGALADTRTSLVDSIPGRAARIHGKPGYMSPEQALGVPVDSRTDVFSTGIMMYELLTHTRLFAENTSEATLHLLVRKKVLSPRTIAPDIARDVADICLHMLARDRRTRCVSARAALHALNRCDSARICTTPGPSEHLRALLQVRFPTRAPHRATTPPVLLDKTTVPLVPSVIINEPHQPERPWDTPTHTMQPMKPPLSRDNRRAHLQTRARQWIGGAIAISLIIIALTLYLTHGATL